MQFAARGDSCRYGVAVVQPAESRQRDDLVSAGRNRRRNSPNGCVLPQSEMSPVFVVVEQVSGHQPFEMPLIQDDHVVKQVAPATPNPALSHPILPRTTKGSAGWAGFRSLVQPERHRLQTLSLGRIAKIGAAVGRPMLLAIAVQPKAHWDFASH